MQTQPKNQTPLKILLIVQTVGLVAYTIIAIQNDGPNFLEKALGFVTSLTWMGQFTLDFNCYLVLSALWIMWRGKFSGRSVLMGMIAAILGIIIFAPYLIYLIGKEEGDLRAVLCGSRL